MPAAFAILPALLFTAAHSANPEAKYDFLWASANYRMLTQSRYAAEAGAQSSAAPTSTRVGPRALHSLWRSVRHPG